MKTLFKLVMGAVAGVGITLAVVVYAHGPGTFEPGMGMMHGPGGFGPGMGMHGPGGFGPGMGMHGPQGFGGPGAVDTHLNAIKSELKLTSNQTKAWDAFETAVHNQAQTMLTSHGQMQAGAHNPDAHIAFMEQRLEGMKSVQKARTDLYNVLTSDQKAVIDRCGFHGPRG